MINIQNVPRQENEKVSKYQIEMNVYDLFALSIMHVNLSVDFYLLIKRYYSAYEAGKVSLDTKVSIHLENDLVTLEMIQWLKNQAFLIQKKQFENMDRVQQQKAIQNFYKILEEQKRNKLCQSPKMIEILKEMKDILMKEFNVSLSENNEFEKANYRLGSYSSDRFIAYVTSSSQKATELSPFEEETGIFYTKTLTNSPIEPVYRILKNYMVPKEQLNTRYTFFPISLCQFVRNQQPKQKTLC